MIEATPESFIVDLTSEDRTSYTSRFFSNGIFQSELVHVAIFQCVESDDAVEFKRINSFLNELEIPKESSFARLCDKPYQNRTVFQLAAECKKYRILKLLGQIDQDFHGGRPTFTNQDNRTISTPLELIINNDDKEGFDLVKERILRNAHARFQYLPAIFLNPLEHQVYFLDELIQYENRNPDKSVILHPEKLSGKSLKGCQKTYEMYKKPDFPEEFRNLLAQKIFTTGFIQALEIKAKPNKKRERELDSDPPKCTSSQASILGYFSDPPEKKQKIDSTLNFQK